MPPSLALLDVVDKADHIQAIDVSLATTDAIDNLESVLKVWYGGISPRYVDLISDYAGQEFFLLDGEAAIQSIFNDPMLDLGGSKGGLATLHVMLIAGFQLLHFVYLVERFFLNLIRRRCRFAVVFFEGNPKTYIFSSQTLRMSPRWV